MVEQSEKILMIQKFWIKAQILTFMSELGVGIIENLAGIQYPSVPKKCVA